MIAKPSFQNLLLTLKWEHVVVGYAMFVQAGSQLVILWSKRSQVLFERSEDAFLSNSTPNSTHNKILTMPDLTDDQNLTVDLRFFGSTLTIFEDFVSVLSALPYMAEFPDFQPMPGTEATETSA